MAGLANEIEVGWGVFNLCRQLVEELCHFRMRVLNP
jgi:hypothetical protein